MEKQLWNVFRETGDPVGYLLYQAERRDPEPEAENQPKEREGAPSR